MAALSTMFATEPSPVIVVRVDHNGSVNAFLYCTVWVCPARVVKLKLELLPARAGFSRSTAVPRKALIELGLLGSLIKVDAPVVWSME